MELTEGTKNEVWDSFGIPLTANPEIQEMGRRYAMRRGVPSNTTFWRAYYSNLAVLEINKGLSLDYTAKKWLGHRLQAYFRKEVPNCSIDNLFDDIENFNNLTGEEKMNPVEPKRASPICDDPAFEIRKLAFGRNIERMSADELIDTVRRFEREIESLKAIKTESKHIAKRITDLELGLKEVVQLLDSKE